MKFYFITLLMVAATFSQAQASVLDLIHGDNLFRVVNIEMAKEYINELRGEYGEPTGVILGEEAGGGIIGSLTYGSGYLYMKDHRRQRVRLNTKALGFSGFGDGATVLMLVYNIKHPAEVFGDYPRLRFDAGYGPSVSVGLPQRNDYNQVVVAQVRFGAGLGVSMDIIGEMSITRGFKLF